MVTAQAQVIEKQTTRIEELSAQVAELTRRLGQNSGNSSLPPSSDRFDRPKRDRRKPTTGRPGKQPGAPGSTLELVADPDEVIDHLPEGVHRLRERPGRRGAGGHRGPAGPRHPAGHGAHHRAPHAQAGLRLRGGDLGRRAGRGGRTDLLRAEPAGAGGVPGGLPARPGRTRSGADRGPDRRGPLDRLGHRPGRPHRAGPGRGRDADQDAAGRRGGDRRGRDHPQRRRHQAVAPRRADRPAHRLPPARLPGPQGGRGVRGAARLRRHRGPRRPDGL